MMESGTMAQSLVWSVGLHTALGRSRIVLRVPIQHKLNS
jgi:hypothetical protein